MATAKQLTAATNFIEHTIEQDAPFLLRKEAEEGLASAAGKAWVAKLIDVIVASDPAKPAKP